MQQQTAFHFKRSPSVENPLGKFQSYVKFQALIMGRYTKGTRV